MNKTQQKKRQQRINATNRRSTNSIPNNKGYVEVKHHIFEGTNVTIENRNVHCDALISNDKNGFVAKISENQNGTIVRFTADFKMVDNKVHYSYQYDSDTTQILKDSGMEFAVLHTAKPKIYDLEYAVYDLEWPIAAVAMNHHIECDPIRNKLKEMYPKYSVK